MNGSGNVQNGSSNKAAQPTPPTTSSHPRAGSKRKQQAAFSSRGGRDLDDLDDDDHVRPHKQYRRGTTSRGSMMAQSPTAADSAHPGATTTRLPQRVVTDSEGGPARAVADDDGDEEGYDDEFTDEQTPSGAEAADDEEYDDDEDDEMESATEAGAGGGLRASMMEMVESDATSSGQAGAGKGKKPGKSSGGFGRGAAGGGVGTDPIALALAARNPGNDTPEWQATIHRVVKCVVSIRFCQPCSFDTDAAHTSEATGFVVDAERGLILTNRHVVGAGPFWGYVIFDNREEVDAYPIYRDPIHDFGFLKFDPKKIKHMKLEQLELRPELAKGVFVFPSLMSRRVLFLPLSPLKPRWDLLQLFQYPAPSSEAN